MPSIKEMTLEDVDARTPSWARAVEFVDLGDGAQRAKVEVDADFMYEALLSEYEDHYEGLDGDQPGIDELDAEEPTAYWLEVAYQSMKLDLQMALQSFMLMIRVKDPERNWSQEDAPEGRGAEQAAGGVTGASEARTHYKNLRGFLPA